MRYGVYKWAYAKMDVREKGRMRKGAYAIRPYNNPNNPQPITLNNQ